MEECLLFCYQATVQLFLIQLESLNHARGFMFAFSSAIHFCTLLLVTTVAFLHVSCDSDPNINVF